MFFGKQKLYSALPSEEPLVGSISLAEPSTDKQSIPSSPTSDLATPPLTEPYQDDPDYEGGSQSNANDWDDDGRHDPTDPLLTRPLRWSTAGTNVTECTSRWRFARLPRWLRFRRGGTSTVGERTPRWTLLQRRDGFPGGSTLSKESRRLRKVLLLAFVVSILIASLVVIIVTSVRHAKARCRPVISPRPYWPRPVSGSLNFPQQYPELTLDTSADCLEAWKSLNSVPCDQKIWNREWDDGNTPYPMWKSYDSLLSSSVSQLCVPECQRALKNAYDLVFESCNGQERWRLDSYKGHFNITELEHTPIEALKVLVERNKQTCRREPLREADGAFCMVELYRYWNVIDGMNYKNLQGINSFIKETDTSHMIASRYEIGVTHPGAYRTPPRPAGPRPNETQCGWCTLDWLDRKINSWVDGKMVDPLTAESISLSDFIKRISRAGRRCESTGWDPIYDRAVQKYKNNGQLPLNWDDDGSTDMVYVIGAGASEIDKPLPAIRKALDSLENWSAPHQCLSKLWTSLNSQPYSLYFSYEDATRVLLPHRTLLDNFCKISENSIYDNLANYRYYPCTHDVITSPGLWQYFREYEDAWVQRNALCRRETYYPAYNMIYVPYNYKSLPCAVNYQALGHPEWAFQDQIPKSALLDAVSTGLAVLENSTIPTSRNFWAIQTWNTLNFGGRRTLNDWRMLVRDGVCGVCIWNKLVINSYGVNKNKPLSDWLQEPGNKRTYDVVMGRFVATCGSRGAFWTNVNAIDRIGSDSKTYGSTYT